MTTRRERKKQIHAEVRELKSEVKALPRGERKARKRAIKQDWKARKKSIKQLDRAERRQAKRDLKTERKLYHRPRRFTGWGITAVVVALIAWVAVPYVGIISNLLNMPVDSSTPAAIAAREAGNEVSAAVADEGIVLLQNESETLPLGGDRVNIFGFESFNLRYGGAGSGASDLTEATTLYDALERRGITANPDLIRVHEDAGAVFELQDNTAGAVGLIKALVGRDAETEPAPDYLTDEVLSAARAYADTAIVVIGNDGAEAADFTAAQLRPTDHQLELIDRVSGAFDKVVIVVNSGNQMELGIMEDYDSITAALWIGTPGPYGAESLAGVLSGEVNPSGRLPITYAYDVESAPATENFGDYSYANANRSLLEYEEGIYVGYRFYETFYTDETAYREAVQFPFGYGLSYTDFDWSGHSAEIAGEEIRVQVTVTNAGERAGKDVVQVYAEAPYAPGGLEKAARELVGYAKTSELEPGESETVTITFPVRDMASWDSEFGGYVLEAGAYDISTRTDVHTSDWEKRIQLEQHLYDTDGHTGAALETRFADVEGDLTYLSRDDWSGTYPQAPEGDTHASDELLAAMAPEFAPESGEVPQYGVEPASGEPLLLSELTGVAKDDPKWEKFLDQLTLDEQLDLFVKGGWKTVEVERLGIPRAILLDGPAGLNYFFGSFEAAAYPTEVVLAATWNDELAHAIGAAIGDEALAYGAQGWYAPGMNLHRTAMGGRNFEYFSEDPLLTGRMGAGMIKGAEDKGITVFMKHFVLNDQEINARSGVNVFVSEQALRELYLRPFEIAVKEGGATGAMSSFIHLGPRWAGGHEVLLGDVLRGEWGFEGVVTTDAVLGAFMDPVQAVHAGNDIMLSTFLPGTEKTLRAALKEDPAGLGWALRDRVAEILYMVANSDAMNG